jgi:tetratricopeptide (TPR) repeat protein
MEKMENLSPDDNLTCLLLRIQILLGKGEYEKSLSLAGTAYAKSQEIGNSLREIDAITAQAEALEKLGKFDESLKLINQCEQNLITLREVPPTERNKRKALLLYLKGRNMWQKDDPERASIPLSESLTLFEELGNKQRIALCLRNIGNIHYFKGEIDRSIQYYEQSYQMSKELDNKRDMASCLNNIGLVFRDDKNDLENALEYLQQSVKLAEELDNKSNTIFYLQNLGWTFHMMNETEQAEESYQRVLKLHEIIGNKERLAQSFVAIGNSYWWVLGDFNRGLEYLQRGLVIFEETGDVLSLARTYNFIAWIYKRKGELDLAIEYCNKSLSKHQEIDDPLNRVYPLLNLATIYQARGDQEEAKEYAKKTLTLSEESGNEFSAANALYLMVNIALDKKQIEEAREFSQQLQDLYTRGQQSKKLRRGLYRPLKFIRQLAQITDGLILKTSPRLSDKAKAQEIFKKVAEEPVATIEFTSTAMLHLCDLLLFELKASGNQSVLIETKNLVKQFREKAQSTHSYSSVVNALILQSKLNTVEGNLNKAAQILDQAAITAEEKGLARLLETVKTEKMELENQFDTWQRIIQNNAPFQKRIEQAQVETYLLDALKMVRLEGKSSTLNE